MAFNRKDGEWFRLPRHGHIIICCDCSLTHFVRSRLTERKNIEISVERMQRSTAMYRRHQGIKVKRQR